MTELHGAVDRSCRRRTLTAFAAIVLLGIVLYGHTLRVPWYMDDLHAIVENRTIQNLAMSWADLFSVRGVTNLTFALNYHFGGTNVVGYHIVNIAIHLTTSCLVYLLLTRVFREHFLLPLLGTFIFVAHPLQTQAVTYIVQRMTILAALFFFLALYLFVRCREVGPKNVFRHGAFYACALFCGALAVFTKQNTAILPVALLLFDRYFLQEEHRLGWRSMLLSIAPFAVAPAVLAFYSLVGPLLDGAAINDVGGMPDLMHLKNLSPLNYLVTEFSVIWLYLRLLFLPYGQALDYDLPIIATIWSWKNLAAFMGIAALLLIATYIRKRLPFVSAGIFWFFLGLVVESTFIPLDPVFEHRLYIPMFGFALVVLGGFSRLSCKKALIAGILTVTILSTLTWLRNDLWNDPLAFHLDNLSRAPRSERVHLDVANVYRKDGKFKEAEKYYLKALEINQGYALIHINLSIVYTEQKEYQKAVEILLEGIRKNPYHFKLYNNIGVLYNFLGRYAEAETYLKKGIALEPYNSMVFFNLAIACDRLDRLDEAIRYYRQSIELDSGDPMKYFNLGLVLHRKGTLREALQAFSNAIRLNPNHAGTLYNAGMVAIELGDLTSAQNVQMRLQSLEPGLANRLLQHLREGRHN